jgi:Ca-activated chloride channel family protein
MKKCNYFLVSVLLIFMIGRETFGIGVLFCRPRFSDQQYQKMWIKTVSTTVDIQDQIAVTHVNQIFYNELTTSVETVYIFPLPENAVITELVYWFNGQRYVAQIRERQEAVNDYNKKVRQWLDPALLEYLGNNLFRLSIVPVNALSEVRTEITYIEPLKYDLGKVGYTFLLNALDLSPKALQTVSVEVNATAQRPFKNFQSPSHQNSTATNIEMINEKHYRLFFGDENFYPDRDLRITFETFREDVDMRILTYTPSPADSFGTDSFYAIWITPPDSVSDQDIIPKDIVFTVDVSSSMEGERIFQVKEALYDFVNLLQPYDRFNIITFGTFVQSFRDDLVPATTQNLEDADDFIFQLYALGMTNIDGALTASLQQSYGDSTSNNLIFLTDGEPTWGETDTEKIMTACAANNIRQVRLFSFGVGEDINEAFLQRLSRENHGYAQFIASDDSIALVVNYHFTRISKPVMTDIHLDLGGLQSWDIYPKVQDDLFWGTQVMRLGLYRGGGTFPVTLGGNMRKDSVSFTNNIYFADTTGGHRFVPRLWAKAKIDYIMEQISIYGESQELIDQIIDLSLRFQILTPYTAFYSDPTEDPSRIDKDNKTVPDIFVLYQNYPNPFNPETWIRYQLPMQNDRYHVVIRIYDLLGRLVLVLKDAQEFPGLHVVRWNGLNSLGEQVPSGVYLFTISAGPFTASKKMLLIR